MRKTGLSILEIYQHVLSMCLESDERLLVDKFIQKHQIDHFLNELINQIQGLIDVADDSNALNIEEIKTIAYKILKKFNLFIKTINDLKEKDAIKNHLVKVLRGILIEIHQKAPQFSVEIKMAISHGMQQAVFVEQYNKEDFEKYFQLDYIDISLSKVSIKSIVPKPYLVWKHGKANLKELCHLLSNDYDCIKSQNDFETLFDNPDKTNIIKWNSTKADLLIFLFNRLYLDNLIEIKRGKGLWKILKIRFVDFDKNTFKVDFAKRLNKLKADLESNPLIIKELDEIINKIKVRNK